MIEILPYHDSLEGREWRAAEKVNATRARVDLLIVVPEEIPEHLREAWIADAVSELLRGAEGIVDWGYVAQWNVTITNPYIEGSFINDDH